MKTICVTGAGGYIGSKLANVLADDGNMVHAFIRKGRKQVFLDHPRIKIFRGDVLDPGTIKTAMRSCEEVYHLAAFVGAWHRDNGIFDRVNVNGTLNVLAAAEEAGVRRMVFTSTAAVCGVSPPLSVIDEEINPVGPVTQYAKSKSKAEQLLLDYKGTCEIVIVNPTRVFGPDVRPCLAVMNRLLNIIVQGRLFAVPGKGRQIANWAYIDDVIVGHVNAMRLGMPGHRYILGGHNISNIDFFRMVAHLAGTTRMIFKIPAILLRIYSIVSILLGWLRISSPRITPDMVTKYLSDCRVSCAKAQEYLKYTVTPVESGVMRTIQWLQNISYHENHRSIPECEE